MPWPRLGLEPGPHEPAHGFLPLLALRNGYVDARSFARDFGVCPDGLLLGHGAAAVEGMARLPPGSLTGWSPRVDPGARRVSIGGETLRTKDWSTASRRWCPSCLRSDLSLARAREKPVRLAAFHRTWWDVTAILACPEHGSALLAACPSCGSPQRWNRASLHLCDCGASLAKAPSEAATDPLGAYLHARVLRGRRAPAPILDSLPLHAVVPLVERLGLCALAAPGSRWASVARSDVTSVRAEGMVSAGYWPSRFLAALDRVVRHARAVGARPGMHGTYGWIHESWVSRLADDEGGKALRSALRHHAERNGVVAEGEGSIGSEAGTIDLTSAAMRLGMGHARARRTLGQHGALPRGRRRSVAMPIDATAVSTIAEASKGVVDLSTVGRMLGVGKRQARLIAQAGLLVSGGGGGRPAVFKGHSVEAVHRLLAAARDGAPLVRRPPKGVRSLVGACQASGMSMIETVSRLVDGRVVAVGVLPGEPSLAGILVATADLAPERAESAFLTLDRAAAALGIHPEAMLQLVRRSLVPARREAGRWAIAEEDLERFRGDFVTGAELARAHGTSPRNLVRVLAREGTYPEFGPPSFRQAFFRRDGMRVSTSGQLPVGKRRRAGPEATAG